MEVRSADITIQKRETDTRERRQTFRKRRTEWRVSAGGRSAGEIAPERGRVRRRRGRQAPGSRSHHTVLRYANPEAGRRDRYVGF